MPRPATLRSTPCLLLALSLLVGVAVGLAVAGVGLWVAVQDAMVRHESWDGAGLILGGVMVAGGLGWALPHLVLVLWLGWARRVGRPPQPAGVASVVLAGALLMLQLCFLAGGGARPTTLLVPLAGCVLVLGSGVLVLVDRR